MRRLVCVGCGAAEDLDNPTGDIHTMRLVDTSSVFGPGGMDKPIEEDLCSRCRKKIRREYFGETEAELLEMPLMKGA